MGGRCVSGEGCIDVAASRAVPWCVGYKLTQCMSQLLVSVIVWNSSSALLRFYSVFYLQVAVFFAAVMAQSMLQMLGVWHGTQHEQLQRIQ